MKQRQVGRSSRDSRACFSCDKRLKHACSSWALSCMSDVKFTSQSVGSTGGIWT
jgi:hypothetical protein